MTKKRFDRAYIELELTQIGKHLAAPLRLYLIGGCALSLRNLKEATFDVDVIVENPEDYTRFVAALKASGFNRTFLVSTEHAQLNARDQLENLEGLHFDIFIEQVARILSISPAMKARAEPYRENAFGNLNVYLMSAEDIFLFKGFASRGRERDYEDMELLIPKGLDWRVIREEAIAQSEQNSEWLSYFLRSLEKLQEHNIQTPIYTALLKEYDRIRDKEENKNL